MLEGDVSVAVGAAVNLPLTMYLAEVMSVTAKTDPVLTLLVIWLAAGTWSFPPFYQTLSVVMVSIFVVVLIVIFVVAENPFDLLYFETFVVVAVTFVVVAVTFVVVAVTFVVVAVTFVVVAVTFVVVQVTFVVVAVTFVVVAVIFVVTFLVTFVVVFVVKIVVA